MRLIKAGWITFEETSNISTNPLLNHALGSGSINALEAECSRNLRALMARARCEKDNMDSQGCP
jgi:hypothetical protein